MYFSKITAKGNQGCSPFSQADADIQAAEMDTNNCYNCRDCSDCSNCRDCSNCYNCSNCRDCGNCSDCSNCRDCRGSLKWAGPAATKLLCLNGLNWPVSISNCAVQIGCQNHTIEEWGNFTDKEIAQMDGKDSLRFWREHKNTIMTIAKAKAISE
jgi:hypothetical protein